MRQPVKIDKAAVVIPYNSKGEILLQERDQEPEVGSWVIFGGKLEEGERPLEALHREMMEELEWKLPDDLKFEGEYEPLFNGGRYLYVYSVPLESIGQFTLHEGTDLRFFSWEEIQQINVGLGQRKVLEDFIKKL